MFFYILKTYGFLAAFAPVFIGAILVEVVSYRFPLYLCRNDLERARSYLEELRLKVKDRGILSVIFTLLLFYIFADKIAPIWYIVFAIAAYFSTPDFLRVRYWFLKNGWCSEDGLCVRFFGLVIVVCVFAALVGNTDQRVIAILPLIFMFGTTTARHFMFRG